MSKGNVFSQKDIDDWLEGYRARLMARPKPPSEAVIKERLEKQRTRLTAHKLDSAGGTPQYRLSDAAIEDELAEEYGYYIVPAKDVTDYHTLYVDVPAGLFRNALQAPPGASPSVQTRVSVTKQSSTQYVGMAKYDLYWRLDDPHRGSEKAAFTINFYKGAFGLWLRLCLVIGLAVALSTYLSGVISLLVAGILYLLRRSHHLHSIDWAGQCSRRRSDGGSGAAGQSPGCSRSHGGKHRREPGHHDRHRFPLVHPSRARSHPRRGPLRFDRLCRRGL